MQKMLNFLNNLKFVFSYNKGYFPIDKRAEKVYNITTEYKKGVFWHEKNYH